MRLYLSSFRIGNRPDELLKLLPGRRRTGVIVNADDYKTADDRVRSLQREIDELTAAGLEPTEIDLRRYFGRAVALQDELARFDALYVRGGNVFILRRAFKQSGADDIVRRLLERDDLVYAGYSAGPCLLGPTLRGADMFGDDPNCVPDGYDPSPSWEGLGVLPYAMVPHYRSDHPETAGADRAIELYIGNHIPFIALRDGEVLIIEGEKQKVVD